MVASATRAVVTLLGLLGLLGLMAITLPVALAQDMAPNHPNQPSGAFLRQWLLCGPFSTQPTAVDVTNRPPTPGFNIDFLVAAGGERAIRPQAGQTVTHPAGKATWTLHEATNDAINLRAAVSTRSEVAAYAYCTVECDTDQNVIMAVGSNDGVSIWINGEQIWCHRAGRILKRDEDRIPVRLKGGRNAVLLKIDQWGGNWEFACRFLPFDATRISEKLRLYQITARGNQPPLLSFAGQSTIVGPLLQSAEMAAFAAFAPDKAVWATNWTGGDLPIGVDTARFGEFFLRVTAQFTGGQKLVTSYPFSAGERLDHCLFSGGKTDYSIVVATGASDSEKWAAQELQHWLKEVGGVEFPVVALEEPAVAGSQAARPPGREIGGGFNARTRELLGPQARPPVADDESFTYENLGPAVVIWGGRQRGTMYGVMAFLENELGVRWYTPQETITPKREAWHFVNLKRTEQPGLRVRNDFYFEAFDPIWAARNRINGAMGWREQPGGLECYWGVHTFFPLLPPSEFFEAHPEYYSLINGRRTHERAQLCLSNPDVLRLLTERFRKVMRENPNYRIYDVSQNDCEGACQCEPCQTIARREGSESGPVIWFVNQVAEKIEAEFPDKFVGTLAYVYTRKPPATIRPRHNVIVRLCSIECCFAHPFTTCPENKSFVADMNGWAAVAPHIYIWDYVVNFGNYTMPYPNFRVLQPNLLFFRDHHAIGVMEQAAYQSRGGEFAELRAYVLAKLLWNPEKNVEPLVDDFLAGYYGRSGSLLRRYLDRLHTQLTPDTHIGLGTNPSDKLFSGPFIRDADALFDQAETVADTDAVRRRVELARLPLMFLKCKHTPAMAREDGTYARLRAIMARENVRLLSEGGEAHMQEFFREVEAAQ